MFKNLLFFQCASVHFYLFLFLKKNYRVDYKYIYLKAITPNDNINIPLKVYLCPHAICLLQDQFKCAERATKD